MNNKKEKKLQQYLGDFTITEDGNPTIYTGFAYIVSLLGKISEDLKKLILKDIGEDLKKLKKGHSVK
jgi:hypothetical protein